MRWKLHALLLCLPALAGALIPFAHAEKLPDQADRIRLEVRDIGKAGDGSLVLGIRIFSKSASDMDLVGEKEEPGPNSPRDLLPGELTSKPFSMAGSYLIDSYTGKRIESLPSIPDEPFFGSMSLVARIKKGGWIKLGVAFPKLPPPPTDSKGDFLPYKFLLHTPLDAEPVLVMFPAVP